MPFQNFKDVEIDSLYNDLLVDQMMTSTGFCFITAALQGDD
jgi:hypothetical protein